MGLGASSGKGKKEVPGGQPGGTGEKTSAQGCVDRASASEHGAEERVRAA